MAAERNPRNTPLHEAALQQSRDLMKSLIEDGEDVDVKNRDGQTPLHLCSRVGYKDGVEFLLSIGAQKLEDNKGNTALHEAARNGHRPVCEVLIDLLHKKNNEYRTALHVASENGHMAVAELLMEKGADPNLKDSKGLSSIVMAIRNDHTEMSQMLVNYKKSKNTTTTTTTAGEALGTQQIQTPMQSGTTPSNFELHEAVRQAKIPKIHDLLKNKNVNVNLKDEKGSTPLHIASRHGYQHVVDILLEKRASCRERDADENTPLHLACSNGHYDAMRKLVEEDEVMVYEKNRFGRTPLDMAKFKGHNDIVRFLRSFTDDN